MSPSFSDWVFNSLIERGAVKDYSKTPHTGRGRKPSGSLSVSIDRLKELRASSDPNSVLWGLIGTSLVNMEKPGAGRKLIKDYEEYAKRYFAENPPRFLACMQKAAVAAGTEFLKRYQPEPSLEQEKRQ